MPKIDKEMQLIKQASSFLQQGKLVCFPTETVYGIGADAMNPAACKKIYQVKGRPSHNPLIVHFADLQQIKDFCIIPDIGSLARFIPGPLTLVVQKKENIFSKTITAGLDSVAVRVPSHPIALKLLKEFGGPVAAPSANFSNRLSGTRFNHVQADFAKFKEDIMILPEFSEEILGLESTILDISAGMPKTAAELNEKILRHGSIPQEEIAKCLQMPRHHNDSTEPYVTKTHTIKKSKKISAPGMLPLHYSPNSAIRINAEDAKEDEIILNFGPNALQSTNYSKNLSESGDLQEAAYNLFDFLRQLDYYAMDNNMKIAVAPIPNHGLGKAINDRLNRAAAKNI